MNSDARLLQDYVQQNSEAAFAELVRQHLNLVYATALRKVNGDTHLAEDVCQTVFTALARKAASLGDRTSLVGWLYLSAHHAAAQAVRGIRRRVAREQEAQAMNDVHAPAPSTDWRRVRLVIDDVMRGLAEADREAVLLRFFERRPFAEIGTALNISEDAARMRVDRALEKLRDRLSRLGITSTGAALAAALAEEVVVAAPVGLAANVTGAALSGAAIATSTTLTFMSTPILVAGVVAVASLSAAFYQTKVASQSQDLAANLRRERDVAIADAGDLRSHLRQSDEQSVALRSEITTLQAANVAKANVPAVTAGDSMMSSKREAEQQRLKQVAQEIEARQKARFANFDLTYQALYRTVGFSADQAAQFKTLTFANLNRRDEIMKAANARGSNANDPSVQAQLDLADAEYRQQLVQAFGDPAAATITHFNDSQPLRQGMTTLAGQLLYSETPLTAQQAEQLVEILWANTRNAAGKIDAGTMNANAEVIMAQARAVLNPTQVEAFGRTLKRTP